MTSCSSAAWPTTTRRPPRRRGRSTAEAARRPTRSPAGSPTRTCRFRLRMRGGALGIAAALVLCAATPADAVVGFRAILPVGQGESVNAAELAQYELTGTPPPSFVNQLTPFENLLYDAPALTMDKLLADFPESTMGMTNGPGPLTTY